MKIGLVENMIGRKALDQNLLDEKVLDEKWAHVFKIKSVLQEVLEALVRRVHWSFLRLQGGDHLLPRHHLWQRIWHAMHLQRWSYYLVYIA